MGRKHKLMAGSSCEGEGGRRERLVDRFSDLGEGVAHHILSFLNIQELTCFSVVSKRCRELCLSTPSLNFDDFLPITAPTGEFQYFSDTSCEVRLKLLNSLDRFLLRRGDNKMHNFRLMWEGHYLEDSDETACFCVNEPFRLLSWVQNSVRCKVEELHVEIGVHDFEEEELAFPSCVFHCATLRSLEVSINNIYVKTPSFSVSSNLEYLELRNVDVKDDDFFKWVSCSCKFIKEIILCDLHEIENITIESLSLEKFQYLEGMLGTQSLSISCPKLANINIEWRFFSPGKVSLNICAPNLKALCWKGNVMKHANLGRLDCLEEADICLDPKVDYPNSLFEAFCSLKAVENLVLNERTVKALLKAGSMYAQLDNLVYLHITIWSFSDELVLALVSLLKGTPNLVTLSISYWQGLNNTKSDSDASGFDMKYWKQQDLAFMHQVDEVTIELCEESNGIEFARYILEHAEALDEMVVIHLPEQSDDVKQKLNESKMVSEATVIFQERKGR